MFPRTAVEIQHEHEPAFVANPNVVTFYNSGQQYGRNAISPEGDLCDWFGVDAKVVRDAVRTFDRRVDDRPERPFLLPRGCAESSTYLLQRNLFTRVVRGEGVEPLAVEETVIELLDQVMLSTYAPLASLVSPQVSARQRATVHDIETILSQHTDEPVTLTSIACRLGLSPYHVCRLFRQVTGTKLHQYRLRLRLRVALAAVLESTQPLIDIALDTGFASHSHFTNSFRHEFGMTPSMVRTARPSKSWIRNFLIAPSTPAGISLGR
ncbi:MAG: helix-turn-helix transcriptional regulator [Acidobacteria bacterium]|nr:helix-turn-helix transcriptional regulator [Acidobacteriota bacterium]